MAMNRHGMYSEVTLSKDEEDTLQERDVTTSPLLRIPLMPLRKRAIIKPPSVWTSLRIWAAVRFARLAAWIAP